MIVHILRFSFHEDVEHEHRERLLAMLHRLVDVDLVAFSVIGQELGSEPDAYTHTYCVAFEDLETTQQWLARPEHAEMATTFGSSVSRMSMFDFSDDMDPALSDRMKEMQPYVRQHWETHGLS